MKDTFEHIYKNNLFGGDESKSGPGSSLSQTETIRRELPMLLKQFNINTIIDAPCGDFNWMKVTNLEVTKYIGIDIVPEIINDNNKKYSNEKVNFLLSDITNDPLEKVDLIFSRDCLVHFSFSDVIKALENFKKSKSTYLLTTTFPKHYNNVDIQTGEWQPLNLQAAPFNFPPPIALLNENYLEQDGLFSDKSLGLWLLKDL